MALAPFRRERAVKEILLVKALPLRVVLLYRTAGWNARLFRKSLCKRLCKSLKSRSSAEGRPSADPAVCRGFYPQQRVSGSAVPAACRRRRDWLPMGRLGIAAVWRRRCRCSPAGYAVPTARGKRGQGHRMVPLPPLDSPKPSFAPRLPSVAQRNGGNGGSVPCVGSLLGRCQALNLLCVNRSAVSARPDSAGRQLSAAKSSASIKGVTLEHQTSLWAPRI